MKKRVSAFMLSFAYVLTSFNIPVSAEGDTSQNVGGYWSTELAGIRFSLVTPDDPNTSWFEGETKKIVDVFDYKPIGTDSTGSVGNALNDNDGCPLNSGNYADVPGIDFEYRVFNQCKIDIARNPGYDPDDGHWNDVAPAKTNPNDYWHCADIRQIFKHSPDTIDRNNPNFFETLVVEYIASGDYFALASKDGATISDRGYAFLNGWVKGSLISDGNENTEEFYGVCDLLEALGCNIFTSGDSTSMRELYINVIREFVIPNYAIIIEPIYVVPMRCYHRVVDAEGDFDYVQFTVIIYYGSATELAMVSKTGLLPSEKKYYPERYGRDAEDKVIEFGSGRLYMNGIIRGLAMKAAYLNEEYAEELSLYTGGAINYLEDCEWDYYTYSSYDKIPEKARSGRINWTPANYKNTDEIVRLLNNQCGLIVSAQSFSYNPDYLLRRACGMTMITSSDIVKPVIEAFDYEFPVDTEVVTSVEVSNKSLDESFLPTVDEVTAETVTNANNVPVSLVCEFLIDRIESTDDMGITNTFIAHITDPQSGQLVMTDEVKQRFFTEEGFDDSTDEPGGTGDEPLPDIPAAYYATIDGLVSKGISMQSGYADAFASINWTTPKQPCKVYFRVKFYNANYDIEPVLGTSIANSRNRGRETKILSGVDGICYTDFSCTITDEFRTTVSEIEHPNPVSITSVETARASSSVEEHKRFEQSIETRDKFFNAAETAAVQFNADLIGNAQPSTVHEWTEFVTYNNGTDIALQVYQHRAEAKIENDENSLYDDGTSRVVRTDLNDLYEPYSDKLASGYGFGIDFTSHFDPDPLGQSYNRSFTMRKINNGNEIVAFPCSNNIVTNYQRGAVLLPEYLYEDYYAEIEPVEINPETGKELLGRYCLIKNENSINYANGDADITEKSRIHFTPVWYPNGKYQIAVFMTDAYTPVGQLWYYRLYDIEIDGSIYDTWYVTRTNNY